MRKLVPLVFLLLFSGCAKSTSLRGFNELTEVATTLFRNNTEELGYTIITEGGGSSATSGSMKYRVYERKIDYGAVKSSAFSRIEESIRNKGFRIHGRSSYGDTARTWEFDGLGISGVLRVDFTESKMGESATIIFVATRKNENGAEPGARANDPICHASCSEQHEPRQTGSRLILNVRQNNL